MKDWVGFSKDSGTDTLAKVGQWNLAVAARSLAEALQEFIAASSKADALPVTLQQGRSHEFTTKSGERLAGEVHHFEKPWVRLKIGGDHMAAVRASEIALFRESGGA